MPIDPTHPTLQAIEQAERRVWQALVDGDAARDAELLADAFLGVYPDGFAQKADHTSQLDNGPTVEQFDLTDIHARLLGTDHAMISYRAVFTRTGRAAGETMYVTSVWAQTPAGWRNIFSQDTPAS